MGIIIGLTVMLGPKLEKFSLSCVDDLCVYRLFMVRYALMGYSPRTCPATVPVISFWI